MSDDDEIVESFSPAGKVLQPFNSVSLSPEEVLTKTKALEAKSPNWGRLFTPVLAKKEGDRLTYCWLKCLRCSVLLSPSTISARFKSHKKGCKAIKFQAIALPGAPTATGTSGASSSGLTPPGSIQVLKCCLLIQR